MSTVIDLTVRVIEAVQIAPTGNTTVDLTNQENGVYIIKITSSSEDKAVYRVIKQ